MPYSGIDTFLIKEGIITIDERQKASSNFKTDNEKQRLFCDIVLNYNLEQCRKFLKYLKRIENFTNNEKLYKKLEKALLGTSMPVAIYIHTYVQYDDLYTCYLATHDCTGVYIAISYVAILFSYSS